METGSTALAIEVEALREDNARLRVVLDAIRDLHHEQAQVGPLRVPACDACGELLPCRTIRILDGQE